MLFGHQDNNRLANAGVTTASSSASFGGGAPAIDPSGTAGLPSIPDNFEPDAVADSKASALNQTADTSATDPVPQINTVSYAPTNDPVASTPVADALDAPADAPTDLPAVVTPTASEPPKAFDADLLSLKQQALAQLEPLVDHLDQTPEEKFRTTMMLIQSADNQALIKVAYEAANAIPDEKIKAQALLDVVNEINYFAQKEKAAQ